MSKYGVFSGPYFPIDGVSLQIQSECGEIRTRKTPNADIFHAVNGRNIKLNCAKWNYKTQYYFIARIIRSYCTMFSRIIKNGTNKPPYFKNIEIKPVAFRVFFFIGNWFNVLIIYFNPFILIHPFSTLCKQKTIRFSDVFGG